ncbi:MAG: amino acid permease [Clostridia bacterium]|nr:amino acid permease [Clostridia bacterium]
MAVWALSFGCSVGWGAFVMPGSTFLPIAGPAGTAIGIGVGALIIFIIGVNYHFLMNRFPDAGGTFSFTKHVFGYDHAFLSSWFMVLVYLAIIWANCTALPLIFRTLFGDILQFGYLYTIAGYEVYLGEILLSVSSILLFGLICLKGGKIASSVQIAAALILIAGITVGLVYVISRGEAVSAVLFKPAFSPENHPLAGILFIVCLAPWAFAGFESVSQSTEEFKFPVKKTLLIISFALVSAAAAYIMLVFIASSAVPEGYTNWFSYVSDLDNPSLSGASGSPVFNGILSAAGIPGLIILGVAAAAAIITGLIGNMTAASRLVCSIARDDLISERFGRLNRHGVPKAAILFLMGISFIIPFFGRAAIGWVVDINTIGVTIAYAYTSAAAFKEAAGAKKKTNCVFGLAGILVSFFFLFYFLIPNSWSASSHSSLSTESYLMLLVWIVLGFVVFFLLFRHDRSFRIGKTTFVWIVLLLLLFSTSTIWAFKTITKDASTVIEQYAEAERGAFEGYGVTLSEEEFEARQNELEACIHQVTRRIVFSTLFLLIITIMAMMIVFRIYSDVQKRHQTAVERRDIAEQSSNAKTTFLSNMSHDIRTPMNAIVGYVQLAKREKDVSPAISNYLSKIEASSDHLLALINDVLELSRIESGKMELSPVPSDLRRIMEDLRNLFATQMEAKNISYTVSCDNLLNPFILCDANRLNRVLLNLVSNAYKYTPEGGSVTVTLSQTGTMDGAASFCISVKDTGIGMSKDFASKVFEAYERERTSAVETIQGTGLGTAITKSIVDLMGGTIEVFSEKGKGSEFVVRVSFPIDAEADDDALSKQASDNAAYDFAGMRLLLVEDNPDNCDISKRMFEEIGFSVDVAVNGEEAVEAVASYAPGRYSAVIMDIEMPVKNGYEAARLIRSLKNPGLAGIPIVALTAKAFSEDIAAAREAGMDAHISKPVSLESLRKTMEEVLL